MTLVYAHRGASARFPEHSLPAFEEAVRVGADGVECDVRLTADGVAVLWHDRTVNRTSDGSGLVSTRTLAELRALDVYHWRSDVPPATGEATRIVTLEQLLDLIASQDRPMRIAIETKHPVRYGGAVEREVARLLTRFGLAEARDRVMVMSFSAAAVTRAAALLPALDQVFLQEKLSGADRRGHLPKGATMAGPDVAFLAADPELVLRHKQRQHGVYTWTVDSDADLRLCFGLGVDSIGSNVPHHALAVREAKT